MPLDRIQPLAAEGLRCQAIRLVTLQSQVDDQLTSAEVGPAATCFVQGLGEVVGLGHKMTRTSSGHTEV